MSRILGETCPPDGAACLKRMTVETDDEDIAHAVDDVAAESMDGIGVLSSLLLSVLLKLEDREYRVKNQVPPSLQQGSSVSGCRQKWEESGTSTKKELVEFGDSGEMHNYQELADRAGSLSDGKEEQTTEPLFHDGDGTTCRHVYISPGEGSQVSNGDSLPSSEDNLKSGQPGEFKNVATNADNLEGEEGVPQDVILTSQSGCGDTSLQARPSLYQESAVRIVGEALLRAIAGIFVNGIIRRSLRTFEDEAAASVGVWREDWNNISTNVCNGNEDQEEIADEGDHHAGRVTPSQRDKAPYDQENSGWSSDKNISGSQNAGHYFSLTSEDRSSSKLISAAKILPEWLQDVNRRIAAAKDAIDHADIIPPSLGSSCDVSRCSSVTILSCGDRTLNVRATLPSQSRLLRRMVQKMNESSISMGVLKKVPEEDVRKVQGDSQNDLQYAEMKTHPSEVPSDLTREKAILRAKLSSAHEKSSTEGVYSDTRRRDETLDVDTASTFRDSAAQTEEHFQQTNECAEAAGMVEMIAPTPEVRTLHEVDEICALHEVDEVRASHEIDEVHELHEVDEVCAPHEVEKSHTPHEVDNVCASHEVDELHPSHEVDEVRAPREVDEAPNRQIRIRGLPPAASPLLKDAVWRHRSHSSTAVQEMTDQRESSAAGTAREKQQARGVVESALHRAVSSVFVDRLLSESLASLSGQVSMHADIGSTPSSGKAATSLARTSSHGFHWFPYLKEVPFAPCETDDQQSSDEKADEAARPQTPEKQQSIESSDTYEDAREKFGSSDDLLAFDVQAQITSSDDNDEFTDVVPCDAHTHENKPQTSDKSIQVSHEESLGDEIEDEENAAPVGVELPLDSIMYIKDQFKDVKALVAKYRELLYEPLREENVEERLPAEDKNISRRQPLEREPKLKEEEMSEEGRSKVSKRKELSGMGPSSKVIHKQDVVEEKKYDKGKEYVKDSSSCREAVSVESVYEEFSEPDEDFDKVLRPKFKSVEKYDKRKSKGKKRDVSSARGKTRTPPKLRKVGGKLRTPAGRSGVIRSVKEKTTPDGFLPAAVKSKSTKSPKLEKRRETTKKSRSQTPPRKLTAEREEKPGASLTHREIETSPENKPSVQNRISFFEKISSRHKVSVKKGSSGSADSSMKLETPVKEAVSHLERLENMTEKLVEQKARPKKDKGEHDTDSKKRMDFKHLREKFHVAKKHDNRHRDETFVENIESGVDYTPGKGIWTNAAFFEALGKGTDPKTEIKRSPGTSRKIQKEGVVDINMDKKNENPTAGERQRRSPKTSPKATDGSSETASSGKRKKSRNRNSNNETLTAQLVSTDDSCISSPRCSETRVDEKEDRGTCGLEEPTLDPKLPSEIRDCQKNETHEDPDSTANRGIDDEGNPLPKDIGLEDPDLQMATTDSNRNEEFTSTPAGEENVRQDEIKLEQTPSSKMVNHEKAMEDLNSTRETGSPVLSSCDGGASEHEMPNAVSTPGESEQNFSTFSDEDFRDEMSMGLEPLSHRANREGPKEGQNSTAKGASDECVCSTCAIIEPEDPNAASEKSLTGAGQEDELRNEINLNIKSSFERFNHEKAKKRGNFTTKQGADEGSLLSYDSTRPEYLQTHPVKTHSESHVDEGLPVSLIDEDGELQAELDLECATIQDARCHSPPTKGLDDTDSSDRFHGPLLASSPRPRARRSPLNDATSSIYSYDAEGTTDSPSVHDDGEEGSILQKLRNASFLRACNPEGEDDNAVQSGEMRDREDKRSVTNGADNAQDGSVSTENGFTEQVFKTSAEMTRVPESNGSVSQEKAGAVEAGADSRIQSKDKKSASGKHDKKKSWRFHFFRRRKGLRVKSNSSAPVETADTPTSGSIQHETQCSALKPVTEDSAVAKSECSEASNEANAPTGSSRRQASSQKRKFSFGSLRRSKKLKPTQTS